LLVFVYPSKKTRLDESVRIALEGQLIRGISLPWSVPPKFFPSGNILTALLSTDERLARRVERALARFETTESAATFAEVLEALRTDALEAWVSYIEGQRELNLLIRLEDDLTVDQAAFCRAHLHNLPGVRVMNRLEYLIENGVFQSSIVVKTGLPREVALKLEANKLYLPGVELDGGLLGRFYPGGESMSHVLGFVGLVDDEVLATARVDARGRPIYEQNDWLGKDGLELKQEQALRGSVGRRRVKLNPDSGRWEIPPGSEIPAIPGKNLTLTIDLELQQAVSEILRGAIAYSNADRRANAQLGGQAPPARDSGAGAVVAIDPRNGEVLAMVSYPHFDNQLFVDGISTRKDNEYRSEEANTPLLDRAVRGQYPPGSTLKLFMAAAALQEKTLDTTKTYTCRGAITVPFDWNVAKGIEKPCWAWRLGGHGQLDVLGAIEQSCDVFFYNVGAPRQKPEGGADYLYYRDSDYGSEQVWDQHYFEGLGIEKIKANLSNRFWFGNPTQIDLPAEEDGVVPDDGWLKETFGREAGWSVGDTINVSIGQGFFLTTPLQLALNTAALANGGTIYRPMLVREVFSADRQEMQTVRPEALRRLDLDPGIIDIVREGMRRVVHGELGTARKNSIDNSTKWPLTNPPNEPEIIIAGKTGTAEFGEQDAQGNYARQHAWFTCFAPLDEPEIALAVVVEDGGEGSSYAVPVADRVLRAYFELTDRRARGQVLRAAGEPPDPTGSVLAPTAAYPAPGQFAAPGPVSQD
jgi:penicillin-binding protein 2